MADDERAGVVEEWLAAVATERLKHIDKHLNELPGTHEELISRQIQKVIEEFTPRNRGDQWMAE